MGIRTLDQFLQLKRGNEWVREPGFESMYVRIGPRYIEGTLYPCVLDLANIEVSEPGKRTFTRLVTRLRANGTVLYVESVLQPYFAEKLIRMGFTPVGHNSYFMGGNNADE